MFDVVVDNTFFFLKSVHVTGTPTMCNGVSNGRLCVSMSWFMTVDEMGKCKEGGKEDEVVYIEPKYDVSGQDHGTWA